MLEFLELVVWFAARYKVQHALQLYSVKISKILARTITSHEQFLDNPTSKDKTNYIN